MVRPTKQATSTLSLSLMIGFLSLLGVLKRLRPHIHADRNWHGLALRTSCYANKALQSQTKANHGATWSDEEPSEHLLRPQPVLLLLELLLVLQARAGPSSSCQYHLLLLRMQTACKPSPAPPPPSYAHPCPPSPQTRRAPFGSSKSPNNPEAPLLHTPGSMPAITSPAQASDARLPPSPCMPCSIQHAMACRVAKTHTHTHTSSLE